MAYRSHPVGPLSSLQVVKDWEALLGSRRWYFDAMD